jgi:hypothetical protein
MRERISRPLRLNGSLSTACVASTLCCLPTAMQMVSAFVFVLPLVVSVLIQFSDEWFGRPARYVGRLRSMSGHLNIGCFSVDVERGNSVAYRHVRLSGDVQRSQESFSVSRLVVCVDDRQSCAYPPLVSREFASGGGDVCALILFDIRAN